MDIKVDVFELGFDLAKGLIPVLEAYAAEGGTIVADGPCGSKAVLFTKQEAFDPGITEVIAALKLVEKHDELTEEDTAKMRKGLRLLADNMEKLWL